LCTLIGTGFRFFMGRPIPDEGPGYLRYVEGRQVVNFHVNE
jgi:hypothetical protein